MLIYGIIIWLIIGALSVMLYKRHLKSERYLSLGPKEQSKQNKLLLWNIVIGWLVGGVFVIMVLGGNY